MKQPFFSIVIPTKNRPELLRDAIQSVLLQNFDDYELIISDNFNDEKTKKVIDEFKDNPHINYFRTESELNMPDHWEFATQKTNGVYTLIVTDRAFLRQGALKDIHKSIHESKKDVSVCFWAYDYYDEISKVLLGQKNQEGTKILKSKNLAKDFARTLDAHFLPRPHTGCYRSDIVQKIKQNIKRLYFPYAPDNISALLFLAFNDEILYIPRPLTLFQGAKVSNVTKERLNPWPFFNSLNIKNPYRFVPIKAPIISNLVFNDLLMVQDLVGKNLKDINIDWTFYFVLCYEEVRGKLTILGADKKVQFELLEEWKKALSCSDEKIQALVRREIKRRYKNILKSYLKSSFLGNFLVKIKRFLLGKPTSKYPNALAAGGFDIISFKK